MYSFKIQSLLLPKEKMIVCQSLILTKSVLVRKLLKILYYVSKSATLLKTSRHRYLTKIAIFSTWTRVSEGVRAEWIMAEDRAALCECVANLPPRGMSVLPSLSSDFSCHYFPPTTTIEASPFLPSSFS